MNWGTVPDLRLLNLSDIFCAFWIINFLLWNFLHEEKTCPACVRLTQNTALTQGCFLHSPLTCLLLSLSHSLLSLFFWPLLLGESCRALRGQKSLFSECQWVTLASPPKSTYNPTLSGAGDAQDSSELLQPFPQGWAVLSFQSFSMYTISACERGKPCPLECCSLSWWILCYFFVSSNKCNILGLPLLGFLVGASQYVKQDLQNVSKKSYSCTDHPAHQRTSFEVPALLAVSLHACQALCHYFQM